MFGDVLCFSHLRWGFVYQRPNHLMSRCARDRRVFFVEEPVFDAATPHLEVKQVEGGGPFVVVPHLARGPAAGSEATQRRLVDDLVGEWHVRDPLLWFYTPMALAWSRHLAPRASAVVYDCMDELTLFDGAPPALAERERELFELADVVFTGGPSLYEAKKHRHASVHAFPSSVDTKHFAKAMEPDEAPSRDAEPDDQACLPRPRVGFFGVIDERMDRGLVGRLAAARPDVQFVFIGPIAKIDPAALPRGRNIHWLGPRPYGSLPLYLRGWDVAMMPFARNAATRFISPTKTLEYLAAGRPIVSTSIRDVVRPYGELGLVRIADTTDAFVAAIDAALAARGTDADARRLAVSLSIVAGTSWDTSWARMWALVRERASRRQKTADGHEAAPCSTV
jgi:UDP-galactopyranose mutase